MVSGLSRKDGTLTCQLAGHSKPPPRHSVQVECVARPKQRLIISYIYHGVRILPFLRQCSSLYVRSVAVTLPLRMKCRCRCEFDHLLIAPRTLLFRDVVECVFGLYNDPQWPDHGQIHCHITQLKSSFIFHRQARYQFTSIEILAELGTKFQP